MRFVCYCSCSSSSLSILPGLLSLSLSIGLSLLKQTLAHHHQQHHHHFIEFHQQHLISICQHTVFSLFLSLLCCNGWVKIPFKTQCKQRFFLNYPTTLTTVFPWKFKILNHFSYTNYDLNVENSLENVYVRRSNKFCYKETPNIRRKCSQINVQCCTLFKSNSWNVNNTLLHQKTACK